MRKKTFLKMTSKRNQAHGIAFPEGFDLGTMAFSQSPDIPTSNTPEIPAKKSTVAVGSTSKMVSSSINSMLYLVQKTSDFEILYKDLTSFYSKLKAMIPNDAGLLRRPSNPGPKFKKIPVMVFLS